MILDSIRINRPIMLALAETHLIGDQAQKVCDRIGFNYQLRVEAQGFSCGIWFFWNTAVVGVTSYGSSSQHLLVEIKRIGEDSWLLSMVYASQNSTCERIFGENLKI